MNTIDLTFTLLSCAFFMGLVALIAYLRTRGEVDSRDGYFLAGRGLTGVFIAGSMLLTNLSAEQLIGLNGSAYGYNFSSMAWEVTAAFATVCMALIFLPRYLAGAFTTLPEFLNDRFDDDVRRLSVVLFLVGYGLITIPSVLYSGSIAVLKLFDVPALLGVSYPQGLVITIVAIGCLGAAYAVFGGLRAVAVSDTINGIGLLIVGVTVPVLGLAALGQGSVAQGLSVVTTVDTHKLNAIGSASDPTPFATLFTGMIFANLFYWCTNQYVIQRTLAAKNLAEGQKGVLLAAFLKIFAPLILVLPGILAAYLVIGAEDAEMVAAVGKNEEGAWGAERAYGALVSRVLPDWLLGFFSAVVVGSILSTFNSVLNSSATLFSLDVYKKFINPDASMKAVVRSGQICSFIVGTFAVIVAPIVFFGQDKIFGFFQSLNGVYFIPLAAIILMGMFNKWVDGKSAVITLLVGLAMMVAGTFFSNGDPGWVKSIFKSGYHYMGFVFVVLLILQSVLSFGMGMKRDEPYVQADAKAVDLTPWKPAPIVGGLLVVLAASIYAFFAM